MNFKTILKVISAIVAIAGVAVAVYLAIQKLTAPKEAEYFDEIVETAAADTQVQEKAEPAEKKAPAKKSAPKKKAPAKKAAK